MNEIIDRLSSMDTETLIILGIAAVLLILFLVLIIVTIRILATAGKDDTKKKSKKKSRASSDDEDDEDESDEDEDDETKDDDDDDDYEDDDDYDDDDDEMSRKVREAVASVEGTKARVEAEKLAKEQAAIQDAVQAAEKSSDDAMREAAAAKVEEIANAVHGQNTDTDTEDKVTGDTQEIKRPKRGGLSSRMADLKENTQDEDQLADAETDKLTADMAPNINLNKSPSVEDEYASEIPVEGDEDYDPAVDGNTDELDTDKIVAALREERSAAQEMSENLAEMAKQRAEAPEYNASFDSAFVERPDNDEKKQPVIPNPTPESVLAGTSPVQTASAPAAGPDPNLLGAAAATAAAGSVPMAEAETEAEKTDKKKKKLGRGKEKPAAPAPGAPVKNAKYFWYNKQDVEGLARKEDMYFKCHYFNDADDIVLDLITEMYDCGYVRTEELQRIAYGITFKSLGMKEILHSDEDFRFNKNEATKEPTAMDKQEAYEKWCGYVNNFMEIAVINAPDDVKEYVIQKMYDYGNRDIEDLMYSPY